ncbi:MAG: thiolase family protein [Acidobacteria bacterium]|nr:thiolase family protein [Acidobacteriota bacterium]MCB9397494.1 thiolase family protein [Acidobacteriota bacterium]
MKLKRLLEEDPLVILDGGRRTPRADILHENKRPGKFASLSTNQLGGIAIKATLEHSGVSPDQIGHVIMAQALESHRDSIYAARIMALEAGIPKEVPALTVRRLCGSGAQAIVNACHQLLLEDHLPGRPYLVAGGAESMQYPHIVYGLRGKPAKQGIVKYGAVACDQMPPGTFAQDLLHMALFDPMAGMAMANTAEKVARQYGISREASDAFAYRSHRLAHQAQHKGWFEEEITPIEVPVYGSHEREWVRSDTHVRPDISLQSLARLPVVFEPPHGVLTPGNASGVVDGAAAMIVTRKATAQQAGQHILARIAGWGIAGCEPSLMGLGPVPATRFALEMAGISGAQIDHVELNEAFAPQALACIQEFETLGIDPSKVNPLGNAIALGHPLGATGAILTLTCAYHLRRTHGRYGLVTMCIGGGQGIALILENRE